MVIKLGLRTRFLLSGAALVLTTVASGVWSALAFARFSQVVGDTLRASEQTTEATASVAGALEREDDALLLALSGEAHADQRLAVERASVEASFARLDALLATPPEHEAAAALRERHRRLPRGGRRSSSWSRGGPRRSSGYHRGVNPLLRRAVGDAERIRDQHFRSTHEAAAWARDEARRATGIVAGISLGALILSVIVSFRLARRIVWPLRELTASVDAVAPRRTSSGG